MSDGKAGLSLRNQCKPTWQQAKEESALFYQKNLTEKNVYGEFSKLNKESPQLHDQNWPFPTITGKPARISPLT